ncbi:hypothetical protein SVA_1481 [Sulfurifustis variabilis]|uniref:TonB-dependent receptor-like beta-barrel domain-containing protein n=1 Tax=Sulfurifustis variabilis TaxID=1675686 RepID=A0A1B4V3B3_9GAMM|nr:hypothetical protein SVA_1481 [Sulfurifustis variabilis]
MSAGVEHHDNVLLTTQPHDPISGTTATARVNLGVRSTTWDVHANIGAKSSWFDEEAFDRDEYQIRLFSQFRAPRSHWQLDGSRLQESLLTSEEVDPDTGLPRFQRTRWTETVGPGWIYSMSATTQLQFRLNAAHVTYEEGGPVILNDYGSESASVVFSKQWSPRTTFSFTVAASQYDVPDNEFESRTRSAYAGMTHRLTPVFRTGLSIGGWRNNSRGVGCAEYHTIDFDGQTVLVCVTGLVDASESGVFFQADAERQFKRSRLSGKLSRDVRPSGSGTEVEFDQASLFYEHQLLASRLWAILGVDASRTSSLSGDPAGVDRDYYQIAPRLRYRVNRDLDLEASYRRARQMYERLGDAATNDSVYLTLTYRPPRMTRSR